MCQNMVCGLRPSGGQALALRFGEQAEGSFRGCHGQGQAPVSRALFI